MENRDLIMSILELAMSNNSNGAKTGFERYEGKNVFIRTVTHHYTGHVECVDSMSLTLSSAAWIPDDGRLNESLCDPDNFEEVELYPNPLTLNFYSFLGVTEIPKLPTEVK